MLYNLNNIYLNYNYINYFNIFIYFLAASQPQSQQQSLTHSLTHSLTDSALTAVAVSVGLTHWLTEWQLSRSLSLSHGCGCDCECHCERGAWPVARDCDWVSNNHRESERCKSLTVGQLSHSLTPTVTVTAVSHWERCQSVTVSVGQLSNIINYK